jgi:hypothetical protein
MHLRMRHRADFFVALILACATMASAHAAALSPVIDPIHWHESSDEIARAFGARAIRLAPAIVFGDSYVDVALRDETLAGFPFVVYFQMDNKTRRLKRIMLERQRHGANPKVFRAVVAALEQDYGPPTVQKAAPPGAGNGYQANAERLWCPDGMAIRAIFRDTTLEASEGCVSGATPCGLTGHLYVQIAPREAGCG